MTCIRSTPKCYCMSLPGGSWQVVPADHFKSITSFQDVQAGCMPGREERDACLQVPVSEVAHKLSELGIESGWGSNVGRIRSTMRMLGDIIQAPDPETLQASLRLSVPHALHNWHFQFYGYALWGRLAWARLARCYASLGIGKLPCCWLSPPALWCVTFRCLAPDLCDLKGRMSALCMHVTLVTGSVKMHLHPGIVRYHRAMSARTLWPALLDTVCNPSALIEVVNDIYDCRTFWGDSPLDSMWSSCPRTASLGRPMCWANQILVGR